MQSTRVQCMAVTHHWLLIATDLSHEIKSEMHKAGLPNIFGVAGHFQMWKFIAGHKRFYQT